MKNIDYKQLHKYNNNKPKIKEDKCYISFEYLFHEYISDENKYSFKFELKNLSNGYGYYITDNVEYTLKNNFINIFKNKLQTEGVHYILNERQYYYLKYMFKYKYNNILFDKETYYYNDKKINVSFLLEILRYTMSYINCIDKILEEELNKNISLINNICIQKALSDNLLNKYSYLINAKQFDLI